MTKSNKLIEAAREAANHAYAPYSNFKVGAALECNGNVYIGCNVENASYPLGQCAEATAIGNMVVGGDKTITHLVIQSPNSEFCYPCGGCRQKIAEFADADTQITMVNQEGKAETVTIAELLPKAFKL